MKVSLINLLLICYLNITTISQHYINLYIDNIKTLKDVPASYMNHSNVVADLLLEKSKRDMADSYHHYDVRPMSDAIIDEQGDHLANK